MSRRRHRTRRGYRRRTTVGGAEALLRIACRSLEMLRLHRGRRNMPFRRERPLFRRRLMLNSARSARVRNMVVVDDGRVVNDGYVVVDVMEAAADMHDRSVIREHTTVPLAAGKTNAHVTEPVIHATVEAYVRTPVSVMEQVVAAFKSPIGRRPEVAWLRRRHPSARNPVIASSP